MSTPIGKELRKLRIDRDERLLDMAKRLDKSASFVSAIEVGKKSPPSDFEESVIAEYELSPDQAERIRRAADLSRHEFTISPTTDMGRDTAGLLARKIKDLSNSDFQEIRNVLMKSEGDK